MKAAAVLLTLLALTNPGTAAGGIRFGLVGGPQITELSSRDWPFLGTPETEQQLRGFAGIVAEIPLRRDLVITTGLEYGELAERMKWNLELAFDTAYGPETTFLPIALDYRLRALSVPVRVEWRKAGWVVGGGPQVSDLVEAHTRTPGLVLLQVGGGGPEQGIDGWHSDMGTFRRWSLAAQADVGREIPLGRHLARLDLRWTEGVTDQQWSADITQRTRAGQLVFGWLW